MRALRAVLWFALAVPVASASPADEQKLVASDATAGAWFGVAVATDGDQLVVGAHDPGTGCAGPGCFSAYVFRRGLGLAGWQEVAKLTPQAPPSGYGRSVAIDGDRAAVGSLDFDVLGSAHLFERNAGGPGAWGEVAVLLPPGGAPTTLIGRTVALSGDVAAVGADEGATGAVYLYARDEGGPGAWGPVKRLTGPPGFGNALALSGDTLAAGVPNDAQSAGSVQLYQRHAGGTDAWGLVRTLTGAPNQLMGTDVSLDGDTLAIGTMSEQAFVHARDAGGADNWGRVARLSEPSVDFEIYGRDVGVNGDVLVVGAPDARDACPLDPLCASGAAYLYLRNLGGTDAWGLQERLVPSDSAIQQEFGAAVAAGGGRAVIGAPGTTTSAVVDGAAYVFTATTDLPALGPRALAVLTALVAAIGARALLRRSRMRPA